MSSGSALKSFLNTCSLINKMALYIVSTPIGNLKDITLRALDTLKEADLILAEDTRRTRILLNTYEIKSKQLISFNDFDKEKKTPHVINELKKDKKIAMVSDSGTPGISDPGFYLTREAVKNNIDVIPIPGPTAMVSALVASGFATDSFVFYGFAPKKDKAKRDFFNELKKSNKTTLIYESPHRILKTLKAMAEIIPEKNICIAREMTKKFEEFIRGSAKQVYEKLKDKNIKGEITIVIGKD